MLFVRNSIEVVIMEVLMNVVKCLLCWVLSMLLSGEESDRVSV